MKLCSFTGCDRPHRSSGYCAMHYKRLYKYGDASITRYSGIKVSHPLYRTWMGIKTRCLNPRSKDYPYYGGRGVTICPLWLSDFDAFCRDVGERPSGTTLDRIDSNGNYEPGNVRWATSHEQALNRRRRTFWHGWKKRQRNADGSFAATSRSEYAE